MARLPNAPSRSQWISSIHIVRVIVAILIPPAAVLAAIHSQALGNMAAKRPGLLALTILTFAIALFFQRLRRILSVTLSYAAALLAASAIVRLRQGIPVELRGLEVPYAGAWVTVLLLSLTAGTVEVVRPNTVLVKRLLFTIAAILLAGYGAVGLIALPNVLSAAAVVAGLCSAIAAVLAHRLTLPLPDESGAELESAEALARRRRERLRALEWRDPLESR